MTDKELAIAKYKAQLPHLYGFKHFRWSREFWESTNRYTFLTCSNQSGKDLSAETMIPTPRGFKRLNEIKIGDQVFGRDGKPCNVIDIPWDKNNDTYKIHFNDGTSVVCGPNHEWIAKSPVERFRKNRPNCFNKWKTFETKEIIRRGGLNPKGPQRFSIPVAEPVERKEHFLFDPYLIGLLIGDGATGYGHGSITNIDTEVSEYLIKNYHAHKGSNKYEWRIKGLEPIIRYYGLDKNSYDKRIPAPYLRGSIKQRLELLQGLMDTDGCAEKKGDVHFSTTSKGLRDDVITLVNSLGGIAWSHTRKAGYKKDGVYKRCRDCHTIQISLDMPLFKIKRKQDRVKFNTRYKHERVIVKIEPWYNCRTICLSVDSLDNSFLCTKNYIVTHNSVVSWRKTIRMCTDTEFQRRVFKTESKYGLYFYPSLKMATREFKTKIKPTLLPQGEMKDDPKYGWEAEFKDSEIYAIHFKNGWSIYFMSYNMKVADMQAMSPAFVSSDEEMPTELWGEISARLMATKGLFSMVCTPTRGEELWRKVFELNSMPNSKVIKATMYDTIQFEDGSPGLRTATEIKDFAAKLPTQRDVDIRVYGKFAKAEGLVFPTFNVDKTIVPALADAQKWPVYCGIDVGSGGHAHPASIAFVAVRPDFKQARLIRGWCGDETETTTSVDILRRYQDMRIGLQVVATFYDYQSREFGLQAMAADETVLPAEKSHELGESLLNTLFKHNIILFEESDFSIDLSVEIQNLKIGTKKQVAKDDRVDSLRYAVVKIPFDLSDIGVKTLIKKEVKPQFADNDRRSQWSENLKKNALTDHIDQEISEWNEYFTD